LGGLWFREPRHRTLWSQTASGFESCRKKTAKPKGAAAPHWPDDFEQRTIAGLEDRDTKLQRICDERLEVIEGLKRVYDERLALIERLHSPAPD